MYVSVCENVCVCVNVCGYVCKCVEVCEDVSVCVQVRVRVHTHRLQHTYGSHRTAHFSPPPCEFQGSGVTITSLILTPTHHTHASKLSK